MSPKLRKCRTMDTSGVTTRKRARIHNLKNNSKSSQDFEKDIKNKKKSEINLSLEENKQSKDRNSLNKQFLEKNTSEKSKKSYTSNKFRMIKNLKPKANKSIVHNDFVSDIENITCKLFNDSSLNSDTNSEQRSIHDLSLNKIVTPKSSPISITLTPQRTTKTPKRSPLHLNSPKTHSKVSLTTPKSPRPRKLMLSVHSPTISNKSEISSKSRKSINENTSHVSTSNVKVKLNKLKISPKGIHSSPKKILRLSKSPKIVLISPKKSKKKSSKMGLSSEKNTSFTILKPEKSPKKSISTKTSNRSKRNYVVNKSLSGEENDLDVTLKNSNNLSALYKNIISKNPVVILERIPLLENFNRSFKSINNQHSMNSTFNVKQIEKTLFNISDSLKTSFSLRSKKNDELSNINASYLTSTPTMHKSHLRISDNMLLQLSPKASSSPVINKKMHRSSVNLNLVNKTNELYNGSQNNSINVNEKETNIADETYELLEPKTPYLQKQCRKRKAGKRSSDNEERDTKRTCKVHFAASKSYINESQTIVSNNKNAELNPSPISLFKSEYVNDIKIRNTPIIKRMSRSVSNSSTNKNTGDSGIKRSLFNNKRKIEKISSSTLNNTKLIGSKEKKDIKVYSAKKVPNFSEVHTKLFSKMESLVDNKIRLIKRHEALKSSNVSKLNIRQSVKSSPSETKRDGYNRFGFKIRKPEATNIILRKQSSNRRQEKREENRVLLKGVRTNRRFELQMKMRNLSK